MKHLILGLLVLTACESNVEKLQRLEGQAAVQCLNEQHYREKLDSARETPQTDSLRTLWWDYRAKCELLTREYNAIGR